MSKPGWGAVEQKYTAATFFLLVQLTDFDREKIARKINAKDNKD